MTFLRKRQFLASLFLMSVVLLSACGENSGSSSGSPSASGAESTAAVSPVAQTSATASAAIKGASSSPRSSVPASSAQSDGSYVLPAGSQLQSGSASQEGQFSYGSPSVFHSVFGGSSSSPAAVKHDGSGSRASLAEYDSIQEGMSYSAVKSIIGSDGNLLWEFGEKGTTLYTVCYRWEGAGISGAYTECTFEDGKLSGKIQFGLGS